MNFIYKIKAFMKDRYGTDDLYKFQFGILIALLVGNLFINNFIYDLVSIINIVIIVYRVLSKDIYRRCRENERFLSIKHSFFNFFRNIKRNVSDKKNLYRKCSCGTTLKVKVPKKRGIKHAKCPSCGKRVRIFTLRKR